MLSMINEKHTVLQKSFTNIYIIQSSSSSIKWYSVQTVTSVSLSKTISWTNTKTAYGEKQLRRTWFSSGKRAFLPIFFAIVSDALSATINCRSLGIVSSTCVTLFEVRARHAFCELKTPRSDRYSRSYWIEEITWNIKFDLHVYPIRIKDIFFNNKDLKKSSLHCNSPIFFSFYPFETWHLRILEVKYVTREYNRHD